MKEIKRGTTLTYSVGAGTVEFIMDAETGEYFFMEMYVLPLFQVIDSVSAAGGRKIRIMG